MTVPGKGAVGKQSNLADRKLTSRINGSNNKGAAQVLVVLDGNQRNGKKKRIMDTLKRLRAARTGLAQVLLSLSSSRKRVL